MAWAEGRRRNVMKRVTFTQEEIDAVWPKVVRSFGDRPGAWNEFARRAIMGKGITVVDVPFDYQALEAQVNRIGVNVNQIAHQVNMKDAASVEEIRTARREVEEARRQIGEAWRLFRIRQGR